MFLSTHRLCMAIPIYYIHATLAHFLPSLCLFRHLFFLFYTQLNRHSRAFQWCVAFSLDRLTGAESGMWTVTVPLPFIAITSVWLRLQIARELWKGHFIFRFLFCLIYGTVMTYFKVKRSVPFRENCRKHWPVHRLPLRFRSGMWFGHFLLGFFLVIIKTATLLEIFNLITLTWFLLFDLTAEIYSEKMSQQLMDTEVLALTPLILVNCRGPLRLYHASCNVCGISYYINFFKYIFVS